MGARSIRDGLSFGGIVELMQHAGHGFASLQPGDVLADKYRIERTLGQGAMGVVLEAKHVELGHDVAIKLILSGGLRPDPVVLERFLREGRVAARLSSPHVARVHDVGRLAEGVPYLVMELVRGRDLKTVLDQDGPQPYARVAAWGRQIADALGEAHALGIVHRDVKPENVMLAESLTGKRTVKVLDFGVSKLGADADAKSLTGAAVAIGSPAYMSPEQITSSKTVDGRTDIWALGVVLYELTTGRLPFDGETVHEVVMGIYAREHVPPSQITRGLPAAFDAIVARCLKKDPNQRFASMTELDEALRPLSEEPATRMSFRPPGPMQPVTMTLTEVASRPAPRPLGVETAVPITLTGRELPKSPRSHRKLVGIAALSLGTILGVMGGVVVVRGRPRNVVEERGSLSASAASVEASPLAADAPPASSTLTPPIEAANTPTPADAPPASSTLTPPIEAANTPTPADAPPASSTSSTAPVRRPPPAKPAVKPPSPAQSAGRRGTPASPTPAEPSLY